MKISFDVQIQVETYCKTVRTRQYWKVEEFWLVSNQPNAGWTQFDNSLTEIVQKNFRFSPITYNSKHSDRWVEKKSSQAISRTTVFFQILKARLDRCNWIKGYFKQTCSDKTFTNFSKFKIWVGQLMIFGQFEKRKKDHSLKTLESIVFFCVFAIWQY